MAKKIIKSAEATPEQKDNLKDNLQKAKSIKGVVKPVGKNKVVKRKPKAKHVVKNFEQDFEYVCLAIERGGALRKVCPTFMSIDKFHSMCKENKDLNERYARAREIQADNIFDDILRIADDNSNDSFIDDNGIERTNHDVIQRSRLMVDARKWVLSKLAPKKYGDKIDVTSDGEKLQSQVTIFQLPDNGRDK